MPKWMQPKRTMSSSCGSAENEHWRYNRGHDASNKTDSVLLEVPAEEVPAQMASQRHHKGTEALRQMQAAGLEQAHDVSRTPPEGI